MRTLQIRITLSEENNPEKADVSAISQLKFDCAHSAMVRFIRAQELVDCIFDTYLAPDLFANSFLYKNRLMVGAPFKTLDETIQHRKDEFQSYNETLDDKATFIGPVRIIPLFKPSEADAKSKPTKKTQKK